MLNPRTLVLLLLIAWPATAVAQVPDPIWVQSVTATSTFASKRNAYDPALTLVPRTSWDKKSDATRYDSAWCEGKPDEGVGEAITIELAVPTTIDTIAIKPGVWMTPKLFAANNRITGLAITTDDGRTLEVTPSGEREEVELKLGGAPVSKLVVRITSVKKGKMNDSCITHITLNDEAPVAVGFDKAAATAFSGALEEAVPAIWNTCDPAKLRAYYDVPFRFVVLENTHASDERRRFKKHPSTLATIDALATWCKKMQLGGQATELQTAAKGTVAVSVETAETMQTMHFVWRRGQWRVTKID